MLKYYIRKPVIFFLLVHKLTWWVHKYNSTSKNNTFLDKVSSETKSKCDETCKDQKKIASMTASKDAWTFAGISAMYNSFEEKEENLQKDTYILPFAFKAILNVMINPFAVKSLFKFICKCSL